jgi:hypothetical protein
MAYTGEFLYALIIYIILQSPVTQEINTSLVNCNCIRVAFSYEKDNTRYFAVK